MAKSPLLIVSAIDAISKATESLQNRTIFAGTDEEKTVNTEFWTGLNLWDLKEQKYNNKMPEEPIITTFLAKISADKPVFMSSLKDRSPLIFTELCLLCHDLEQGIREIWEFALTFEEELEDYKTLNGVVRECFVSDIEPLGIRKFAEVGYHAAARIHYKFQFR